MAGLLKFASKNGKERGLITLFILHSINKKPKSGYELLGEIKEKTDGMWAPSKGTLYPILKHLEEEKLIRVCETGARSKNIFEITGSGKKTLFAIKKHPKEPREKLLQFKNLLIDIFGEEKVTIGGLLFEMGGVVDALPADKKDTATGIMKKCLADLRGIK